MDKTIKVLAAVLALQLVAALALTWSTGVFQSPGQAPQFADVDASSIDEIEISAADGKPVVLRKVDMSWVLPGYGNLPVDESKRSDVIERLVSSKAQWPVATTASAATRFEVTQEKYQRHVVLRGGGKELADLYLGTSPGFRRVHARRAGDDDIFAIDFNNYELPADAKGWLDKALLQPDGEITAIQKGDFKLVKQNDAWALQGLEEGKSTDATEAQSLASTLKSLHVTAAADDAARARVEAETPTFSYGVDTPSGSYTYAFYKDADDYVVKASNRDGYFRVAKYTGDRLNIERGKLIKATEDVAGGGDTTPKAHASG